MSSGDGHLLAYELVAGRVSELARSATEAQLDTAVPACPDWTARQVVQHLAGLTEDWVAGDLAPYGADEWAQAQVDRFEGRPIDEVLTAWAEARVHFAELDTSPVGGTPAMWAFGDAVVHEADLRAVLAPGTRVPDEAADLGLKAAIARWRQQLGAAGVAPLEVVARDRRSWLVGDPGPAGPENTVTTTAYELFRALFGRRSRGQVEAWDWTCDPAPYLDPGLPHPFRWAATALDD